MECQTITIKVMPSEGNPAGELRINACDYDESLGMISVERFRAQGQTAGEKQEVTPEPQPEPQAPKGRVVEAEGRAEGRGGKKKKEDA